MSNALTTHLQGEKNQSYSNQLGEIHQMSKSSNSNVLHVQNYVQQNPVKISEQPALTSPMVNFVTDQDISSKYQKAEAACRKMRNECAEECKQMMNDFMAEKPELWNEDIGE